MRRLSFALGLTAAVMAGPITAAQAGRATISAAARAALARAQDALGGQANMAKVQALQLTQLRHRPEGATDKSTVRWLSPDRFSVTRPTVTHVIDGSVFWQAPAQTDEIRATAERSMRVDFATTLLKFLLRVPADPTLSVTLEQTTFDSQPATGIVEVRGGRRLCTLLLSPVTGRPIALRQEFQRLSSTGQAMPLVVDFVLKDYREFGGIMLPTKIDERGGMTLVSSDITDISVNPKLTPAEFRRPQ